MNKPTLGATQHNYCRLKDSANRSKVLLQIILILRHLINFYIIGKLKLTGFLKTMKKVPHFVPT